jgi:hypothetical protein
MMSTIFTSQVADNGDGAEKTFAFQSPEIGESRENGGFRA